MNSKKRFWLTLTVFSLIGQIAWVIENMYFNVFLYNTISGDTAMIAAMVSASAVTATVTTLVMGALSDKIGRRKALIVVGYLLWGVSVAAFAFVSVDSMGKLFPAASAAYAAAVAVVDPHRPDGGYPHKNLSGVGVAFKLAAALSGDQEAILQETCREKVPVTLFLMNGFQLRGTITGYDNFVVVLVSDGKQQMIYKHAISTLAPMKPLKAAATPA